ncbi:mitochondrial import inner membrane translocase subunit Tim16-like [Lingula anatina]|uniref:Mitochondrial import inner membrane translocase subunit Tim16-like n=1 Tax=Lingula anatina TaxID=7574 RepID=A0A1S3GYX7_LINAN|nr:mitochondrial import inner membrane translocase subunit Tim16-like [Lingula anatina]|eukprot:XP_013378877.1 mitochondrial import inner membrane translocase subunit Tim16-like [Lingula anatina]
MLKVIVQAVVAGSQVVGRAFTRALQQEWAASQQAAKRQGGGKQGTKSAVADLKKGLTIQEAKQILNVSDLNDVEKIQKNYDHLFAVNEKSKGGSFYLQSKVYRAKERIDEEIQDKMQKERSQTEEEQSPPPKT